MRRAIGPENRGDGCPIPVGTGLKRVCGPSWDREWRPRQRLRGVGDTEGLGPSGGGTRGNRLPAVGTCVLACVSLGNKSFLAEEEESEGSVQKRKGKKRKKVRLQPEHLGSGAPALPPEQNGGGEPEGSPGRAQKMPAAEPGAPAAPRPQEHSVSGPAPAQGKRKRPRKRSLRVQGESSESTPPLPRGDEAREPSPPAPPASGAPVQKRPRTLGALPINGSGPPALAWPPPQQQGRPAGPPPGRRLKKKKGEPSGLDLYDPSPQKAAILKKRKKMKEMCNLERRGVLKAEARLVQALVRQPLRGQVGDTSSLEEIQTLGGPPRPP